MLGGVAYPVVLFGVLLFLPAWTFDWWQAWTLLGALFVLSAVTMFTIFPSRPELLEERYKPPIQKGQPLWDRVLVLVSVATFLGQIVFLPLDVFRFRLLGGPGLPVATLGLLMFVAGWAIVALAMRENDFAAPVVRHQAERNQFVVDTGPYRLVRHPMYAGAIPLSVGMALWLGSYAGALLAVVPIALLAMRAVAEERFLARELEGYDDYLQRVRWRLVPGIW